MLINAKVYINLQDNFGCTALMEACNKSLYDVVLLLIHEGANVNLCNTYGRTILINFYAESRLNYTNVPVWNFLEHKKIDVNISDKDGNTALILACRNEFDYHIEKLLDLKSDINAVNNAGENSLVACARSVYNSIGSDSHNRINKIMALLISKGAQFYLCNHIALNYSCNMLNDGAIELLLNQYMQTNNNSFMNVLVRNEKKNIIDYIVEFKQENTQNKVRPFCYKNIREIMMNMVNDPNIAIGKAFSKWW